MFDNVCKFMAETCSANFASCLLGEPIALIELKVPAPDNAAIDRHLEDLLSPAVYSQQAYYRSLGMRDRILTLSLMVAAVVTLLWHQVPSVNFGNLLHNPNRIAILS